MNNLAISVENVDSIRPTGISVFHLVVDCVHENGDRELDRGGKLLGDFLPLL
jgi:hypothetical protein